MATRMQQRRGTAAQWTSANPILNAGEMGWESDTNKFKIGDGTNHWADLDYFIDQSSTVNPAFGSSITFEGATANAYETTLAVTDPTADRTITLPDSTGTVVVADASGNVTVSGNLTVQGTTTTIDSTTIAVTNSFVFEGATANAFETTLAVTDPTADRTITLPDATGTVALISDVTSSYNTLDSLKQDKVNGVSSTEIGYLDGVTSAIQSQIDAKSPIANPNFTGTVILPSTTSIGDVSSTEIGYLNNVTSAIQTQLDAKRNTADNVVLAASRAIEFEGSTDDGFETTLSVVDPTADRSVVIPDAGGTVVLDTASQSLTNKTINSSNNTISITASTVSDFTEAAQDAVGNSLGTGLSYNDSTGAISVDTTAIQAVVSGVSNTEIGYLDGVTSAIQTQLDSKSATGHTHTASNVTDFTEAAQDAIGNSLGSGLSYNDSTGAISVDTATIQARVANVSDTEIGYLDGVTSAIQTQLDNKLALSGGTLTGALTLNADPTSDLHAATKQYVDAATAGLNVHASVKAATTANITLASAVENGDVLDGVTLATGDRILIKNQTTKSQNGVYTVNASGAPTRATDYDSTPEVDAGDFIFVEGGTVNGKTGWVQTNAVATIGTSDIEFIQFSGAGTYTAGTGLTLTGNTFAIDSTVTTDSGSKTLTNKTIALGSNTVSGTTAQFNSALTDGDFATLAGTETLTNKTLTSPIMTTPTLGAASATSITFSDGTQSLQGVPSITPIIAATLTAGVYNLSTGGLTLRDDLIELDSTSAITLRIPTDATTNFPIGTSIDILQTNTGQVTIAAETPATTTVNGTPGLKLRTRWSSATLFKRAANSWVVMGDLSA